MPLSWGVDVACPSVLRAFVKRLGGKKDQITRIYLSKPVAYGNPNVVTICKGQKTNSSYSSGDLANSMIFKIMALAHFTWVKNPIINIENPTVVADADLVMKVDIMKAKLSCRKFC